MNKFKLFTTREKANDITILLLYPFMMVFNAVRKTLSFFTAQKRRIIAFSLTVCMLISLIPLTAPTVSAAVSNPAGLSTPILGTSIKSLPVGSVASVWMGEYSQDSADANNKQPIKWTVILKDTVALGSTGSSADVKGVYFPQNSAGAVSLISEKVLDTCSYMDFKPDWKDTDSRWNLSYGSSKLDQFMDGTFKVSAFSAAEIASLSKEPVTVWGGTFYSPKTYTYATESVTAQVYAPDLYMQGWANMKRLLVLKEAAQVTPYAAAQKWSEGYLEQNSYWLRTVPCYSGLMGPNQGMSLNGRFFMGTGRARSLTVGVRPMTRVMGDNIILVSQVGAKNSTSMSNANLSGKAEYELTLYDNTRKFKATPTGDVIYGDYSATVNLTYTGANVGANEYISYILTDEKGNVYKYERVKTVDTSAGSLSLEIDYEDFGNNNDCELRIFNEQMNGDKHTDYASAYSKVEIVRDSKYAFPIWVDGTRITVDNRHLYGYDPTTNTLTINNTRKLSDYQKDGVCYGVYAEGDLNIYYNVKPGLYFSWTSTGQIGLSQTAIYVSGNLNIRGNGNSKLEIDNAVVKNRVPEMNGIVCGGNLTISNINIIVDTGNGVSMTAIKAKSVELTNVIMSATTQDDLDDMLNNGSIKNGSTTISCESYRQNGGTVSLSPRSGSLGYTALQVLAEGKFELDGKAKLSLYGNQYITGSNTLEKAIKNKDITVSKSNSTITLTANSCTQHTPSYRRGSYSQILYEECLYCKEALGQLEMRAPADLFYSGTSKLVNLYGKLPYAGEVTVTYLNLDTKESGLPVNVGRYRATVTLGEASIREDFSIVQNPGGGVAKTEFQKLQEKINAGGTIELKERTLYAESTDKTLVVPEGVSVKLILMMSDIDRSAAIEPGPVLDVRGTLNLEGYPYMNSGKILQIRGGTDSGIIVRAGGELIMNNWLDITGNTSKGPGAGIFCAGTLTEKGNFRVYGNTTSGEESAIHIANGGKILYDYYTFSDSYATVGVTADNLSEPIAVSKDTTDGYFGSYKNIARRYVGGNKYLNTYFNQSAGKLYLVPTAAADLGTYADYSTNQEKGVQTVSRSDFSNNGTLNVTAKSKKGSVAYIKMQETSSNKNVQLAFQTFSLSVLVPANTTYTLKHDFRLTMSRNSDGSLGYYGEIFYLRDNPNQNLTFTRGDNSKASSGSSGKVYYKTKGGGSKTVSVTATYKNDSDKAQTITQWFGFYAGLGKADKYSHKAVFEMELAK